VESQWWIVTVARPGMHVRILRALKFIEFTLSFFISIRPYVLS
jgi:hypothetical protein